MYLNISASVLYTCNDESALRILYYLSPVVRNTREDLDLYHVSVMSTEAENVTTTVSPNDKFIQHNI